MADEPVPQRSGVNSLHYRACLRSRLGETVIILDPFTTLLMVSLDLPCTRAHMPVSWTSIIEKTTHSTSFDN
jgi:hypothetical protein